MSTNFYAKHIPTESEYQAMQEALTNRQFDKLLELFTESQKQYHIGKRSCGWQFLFVPHIKSREGFYDTGEVISPWQDTLDSIKEYLSREDVQIVDEYGTVYTCEQFFETIKDILYHDKDRAINGYDYDNDPKYNNRYPTAGYEYTTKEGLRFSKDDNWS